MNRQQVEVRVLDVVRRVTGGARAEDDLIECKAAWPEPSRAARRIAGHANAARGDEITWIIGLDEDSHQVVQLDTTDAATWFDGVRKRFADGVLPEPMFLFVPTGDGASVLAIHFETDRAPYLVTTSGGLDGDREVPWRSGTKIRTARRNELLSILAPAVHNPAVELLKPSVSVRQDSVASKAGTPEEYVTVSGSVGMFFNVRESCYLPRHLWKSRIRFSQAKEEFDADLDFGLSSEFTTHSLGVIARRSGLHVNSSDVIGASFWMRLPLTLRDDLQFSTTATWSINMPVSGQPGAVKAGAALMLTSQARKPVGNGTQFLGGWSLGPS